VARAWRRRGQASRCLGARSPAVPPRSREAAAAPRRGAPLRTTAGEATVRPGARRSWARWAPQHGSRSLLGRGRTGPSAQCKRPGRSRRVTGGKCARAGARAPATAPRYCGSAPRRPCRRRCPAGPARGASLVRPWAARWPQRAATRPSGPRGAVAATPRGRLDCSRAPGWGRAPGVLSGPGGPAARAGAPGAGGPQHPRAADQPPCGPGAPHGTSPG
jgi:hypothetical protein